MKFTVKGPGRLNTQGKTISLWEAKMEVVKLSEPKNHRAVRSLFLSRSAPVVDGLPLNFGPNPMLPPGTMIALCRIESVSLFLGNEVYKWNDRGASLVNPSLLLLQALPEEWKVKTPNPSLVFPSVSCLAGEIALNAFEFEGDDPSIWHKHFRNITGIDGPTVHASGLSFEGAARLPWENDLLAARFHAMLPFPEDAGTLRLTLDRDRLTAAMTDAFTRSFGNLGKALMPEVNERPRWAALELAGEAEVPKFYWEVHPEKTATDLENFTFHLEREALHLLLSDQPLGATGVTPRSLLRTTPQTIMIMRKNDEAGADGSTLQQISIGISSGQSSASSGDQSKYQYTATKKGSDWEETVQVSNIAATYDPITTALELRQQQGLPNPDSRLEKVDPRVLWGFVPQEDGWAQLPFWNLTEQIYLDVFHPQPETIEDALLSGAAVIGNDSQSLLALEPGEQPWSVTLLNSTSFSGEWTLLRTITSAQRQQNANVPWRPGAATVTFQQPEVALNGFLWLATDNPDLSDALPSLDNWVAGLRMVPLRSQRPNEMFPAPFTLKFQAIHFAHNLKGNVSYPRLQAWSFSYQSNDQPHQGKADQPVFETLAKKANWEDQNAWPALPLVWRRHPNLPAIQSLPLTQNQTPPNYPSPSRQLAPFQLELKRGAGAAVDKPAEWSFQASSGAAAWTKLVVPSTPSPAREWTDSPLLWMAALSLPGLVFDPNADNSLIAANRFLPAQYKFGLPYTDELNALAQLPKETKTDRPPDPNASPDQPALPLDRGTFAQHWNSLAERAFLSQTDADNLLARGPHGKTVVSNLIEPFDWPVDAALNEAAYPGLLTLNDAAAAQQMALAAETALRGISGGFSDDGKTLKLVKPGETPKFVVAAGSAAAQGGDGVLRDQRGLARKATLPAEAAPASSLLKTPVQLGSDAEVSLCSLLAPLDLSIKSGSRTQQWQLWFRDVPVTGNAFDRASTRSAHARGVNDPAATSRQLAHLTGYEWRLALNRTASPVAGATGAQSPDFLPLQNLHFYPLTLDSIQVAGNDVTEARITGRLQLPSATTEQTDLNNAVQIKFVRGAGAGLQLEAIEFAAPELDPGTTTAPELFIEWPLAEGDSAPASSLRWRKIRYDKTTGEIQLTDPQLEFTLFDALWVMKRAEMTFKPGDAAAAFEFRAENATGAEIVISKANLNLALTATDDQPLVNQLSVDLVFRWDGVGSLGAESAVTIKLLGAEAGKHVFTAALLHGDKRLDFNKDKLAVAFSFESRAIQIGFSDPALSEQAKRQLIPGMHLSDKEGAHGYAVLSFAVTERAGNTPSLTLRSGFLETILPCEWGSQLQEADLATAPDAARVFGSSAGRLYAGYTLRAARNAQNQLVWNPALLLNGFLEVKNLLSWPLQPGSELGQLQATPPTALFDFNQAGLRADAEPVLQQAVQLLRQHPEVKLRIEGHTDNVGAEATNNALSLRRATAVQQELIRQVPEAEARISVIGYGKARPKASNGTPEGQALNRRAEIVPLPSFTLPATKSSAPPALDHLRHTMRVLFNQHAVPAGLLKAGTEQRLFDFAEGKSWQLLAVVEHQLIEVRVNSQQALTPTAIAGDRRWTAVQEVRLLRPETLSAFLSEVKDGPSGSRFVTLDPERDTAPSNLTSVNQGFHRDVLISLMRDSLAGFAKNEALMVEASAPHWIRRDDNAVGQFTNLQYLPRGTQRAILSVPVDFASPNGFEKPWLLLAMPFLGRLQDRGKDGEANDPAAHLRVDPLLVLDQLRRGATPPALPRLPLALSSREDALSKTFDLSEFDSSRYRRFEQLDPATLEESWYRLQNPPAEVQGDFLPSVLAALPTDSPGRLGRLAMLRQSFEAFRNGLPPRTATEQEIQSADVSVNDTVVWRRNNLFAIQGISSPVLQEHGFCFTGTQIYTANLATATGRTTHHTAATMLPPSLRIGADKPNPEPVSFAVSPYLSVEFLPMVAAEDKLRLTVAELLCLDPKGADLSFVASQVWEEQEGKPTAGTQANLETWGREIHARLAADSPIAVLRVRRVKEARNDQSNTAGVAIEYQFLVLEVKPPVSIPKRTRAVRVTLEGLRFAEGQFGGNLLPRSINNFELAPPQTRGVQPLYLIQRPAEHIQKEDGSFVVADSSGRHPAWPWGVSALRFSVHYTAAEAWIVGSIPQLAAAPAQPNRLRLWWNAIAHEVQFALPEGTSPRRLLPARFRARPVSSMLPSLPHLPLPKGSDLNLLPDAQTASDATLAAWQPVLPGSLRYLIVGARAGAPFVFRNHLLCHETSFQLSQTEEVVFASGSVPVQHRAPRPTALPTNQESRRETALQTWASYFDSLHSARFTLSPADNAFLGGTEADAPTDLEMRLVNLPGGVITIGSTGVLEFDVSSHSQQSLENDWSVAVELTAAGRRLAYKLDAAPPALAKTVRYVPAGADTSDEQLRQFVAGLPHGAEVLVKAHVERKAQNPPGATPRILGYQQTLAFPLRFARTDQLALPLRPVFAQFEDPEYNRRLASLTARASRTVTRNNQRYEITLAADRREYNANSQMFVVFFGDAIPNANVSTLKLEQVDSGGVKRLVVMTSAMKLNELLTLDLGKLAEDRSLAFASSDTLLLTLTLSDKPIADQTAIRFVEFSLGVQIVARPVVPAPEAGYALLRRQGDAVECVRFAWAPQSTRIELLNPDDLTKEIVRRRAVFQWTDSARTNRESRYALQKITHAGATHFPAVNDSPAANA